jgi:hypothetical protein
VIGRLPAFLYQEVNEPYLRIYLDNQSKGSIEHFDVHSPKYGIVGTRDRSTCLLRNKYATTSGIKQVGAGSLKSELDSCVFGYKVK